MKKFLRYFFVILIVGLIAFCYVRFFWVFGEGVKAGTLNNVVKKGFIFKTYEGKLIQTGFKGGTAGTVQSNEFRFSVVDDSVANQLMMNSGKEFELHYQEYMGALPWRGTTPLIVDKIISMRDLRPASNGFTQ